MLAALGMLPLVTACGGDFQYKISGDRTAGEQRSDLGGFSGSTTLTHDELLKLQEDYAKKAEEAEAAKSAAGG
jgi:hypothetical protein